MSARRKNEGERVFGDRLYECGACGERFIETDSGGNRCPSCGSFASKVSDNALPCPHCEEPIDLVEWA